jgi:hypothetical protein
MENVTGTAACPGSDTVQGISDHASKQDFRRRTLVTQGNRLAATVTGTSKWPEYRQPGPDRVRRKLARGGPGHGTPGCQRARAEPAVTVRRKLARGRGGPGHAGTPGSTKLPGV